VDVGRKLVGGLRQAFSHESKRKSAFQHRRQVIADPWVAPISPSLSGSISGCIDLRKKVESSGERREPMHEVRYVSV
jgi:hypothetical protein